MGGGFARSLVPCFDAARVCHAAGVFYTSKTKPQTSDFNLLQLKASRNSASVAVGSKGAPTACLDSIGVDQGIHNLLLHTRAFSRYVSSESSALPHALLVRITPSSPRISHPTLQLPVHLHQNFFGPVVTAGGCEVTSSPRSQPPCSDTL